MSERTENFVTAFLVTLVIIWALLMAALTWHEIHVEHPKAYQAWVKLTGNPANISHEEWDRLRRANALTYTQP